MQWGKKNKRMQTEKKHIWSGKENILENLNKVARTKKNLTRLQVNIENSTVFLYYQLKNENKQDHLQKHQNYYLETGLTNYVQTCTAT